MGSASKAREAVFIRCVMAGRGLVTLAIPCLVAVEMVELPFPALR
jgi:hypothetical protein